MTMARVFHLILLFSLTFFLYKGTIRYQNPCALTGRTVCSRAIIVLRDPVLNKSKACSTKAARIKASSQHKI